LEFELKGNYNFVYCLNGDLNIYDHERKFISNLTIDETIFITNINNYIFENNLNSLVIVFQIFEKLMN
jgi:hypothetical protein